MVRFFRVSIPASTLVLVVFEALLIFVCYSLSAAFAANDDLDIFLLYDGGILRIALVVVVIQIGLYFQDLYENVRPQSQVLLGQQVAVALGGAFLLQAFLGYGRSTVQLPRWTMVYGSVMVLLVLPLWRVAFYALISKALPAEKLLFLGASSALRGIAMRLAERPESDAGGPV